MNTASRRRTPAHLLARSLARLCTWRNMTGTRVENELIRWDANEREESGVAWRYALASESPGCRVMSDFVFKGSDTARRQTDNQRWKKTFSVSLCDAVIYLVKLQSLQRIVQEPLL